MISVFGSDIGDQEIEAAVECLQSQWVGFGKKVDDFEKAFASYFNLANCLMVDSGSNALYMAVRLLNLAPDDEIIIPSFTWVSCAQAVLLAGHRPIFCDVDPTTMNVRREDIEPCISPRTKAIMVVHYAGLPVTMQPILDLGYPVIEDAAHAVSATHNGNHAVVSETLGSIVLMPLRISQLVRLGRSRLSVKSISSVHVGFDIAELASQDLKPQQAVRARMPGGNTRYVRHLSKCCRQISQQQLQPSSYDDSQNCRTDGNKFGLPTTKDLQTFLRFVYQKIFTR